MERGRKVSDRKGERGAMEFEGRGESEGRGREGKGRQRRRWTESTACHLVPELINGAEKTMKVSGDDKSHCTCAENQREREREGTDERTILDAEALTGESYRRVGWLFPRCNSDAANEANERRGVEGCCSE